MQQLYFLSVNWYSGSHAHWSLWTTKTITCCRNPEIIKMLRTRLWIALDSLKMTLWPANPGIWSFFPWQKLSLELCAQHRDIATYANLTYANLTVGAKKEEETQNYLPRIGDDMDHSTECTYHPQLRMGDLMCRSPSQAPFPLILICEHCILRGVFKGTCSSN